jgi:phytol kinase
VYLLAHRLTVFVHASVPSPLALAVGGPAALAWAWLCLRLAAYLKRSRGWRTGYTRKVFHFLIFGTVVVVHTAWGLPAVCIVGGATTLVVFYAVIGGNGHPLYEAIAREKDAPRRAYYVMAPYFATLIGGLASAILFPATAVFGFLVAGLGDAVGEPVGTWLGRHTYRVPAFWGVPSTRSIEGSTAVFLACLAAIGAGLALGHRAPLSPQRALAVPLLAAVCALIEAVSPHGWDNATLQIVASCLAMWML